MAKWLITYVTVGGVDRPWKVSTEEHQDPGELPEALIGVIEKRLGAPFHHGDTPSPVTGELVIEWPSQE